MQTGSTQPIHVIVHAGFHKTGTTSLQTYLAAHRDRLAPYASIYLKEDFPDAGDLGQIYGLKPYYWRKRRFRAAFDRFVRSIPDAPVIVLSCEGLSGAMPGHKRALTGTIRNYRRSAIPLARQIVTILRQRFGPETRISFLYTLRDSDSWIRSVYGHILRSIRVSQDFAGFRKGFRRLIALDDEARRIVAHLPGVTLITARLEQTGTLHHGPASALLDVLDLPAELRDGLPRAQKANTGNSRQAEEEFLTLNRAVADSAELKLRKTRLATADRKVNANSAR